MATASVCDWCGQLIKPEPDKWDRQGQPVHIRFAAYEQQLVLCSACLDTPIKLNDLRTRGVRSLRGTLPADEQAPYMPFIGRIEETPPPA